MPGEIDDLTVDFCEQTSYQGPRDQLAECVTCGYPFWLHPGHPQRHCSDACRLAAKYRRQHHVTTTFRRGTRSAPARAVVQGRPHRASKPATGARGLDALRWDWEQWR